jgi:CHASE3 domain sensor protein
LFDFTYGLQQCIQALEPLLKKRVMLLQQTLNIRRIKGFELAQQRIGTDVSGTGNDDIGQFINAMVAEENHHRCCTLRETAFTPIPAVF